MEPTFFKASPGLIAAPESGAGTRGVIIFGASREHRDERMSWVREHVNEIPNRVAQAVLVRSDTAGLVDNAAVRCQGTTT